MGRLAETLGRGRVTQRGSFGKLAPRSARVGEVSARKKRGRRRHEAYAAWATARGQDVTSGGVRRQTLHRQSDVEVAPLRCAVSHVIRGRNREPGLRRRRALGPTATTHGTEATDEEDENDFLHAPGHATKMPSVCSQVFAGSSSSFANHQRAPATLLARETSGSAPGQEWRRSRSRDDHALREMPAALPNRGVKIGAVRGAVRRRRLTPARSQNGEAHAKREGPKP